MSLYNVTKKSTVWQLLLRVCITIFSIFLTDFNSFDNFDSNLRIYIGGVLKDSLLHTPNLVFYFLFETFKSAPC